MRLIHVFHLLVSTNPDWSDLTALGSLVITCQRFQLNWIIETSMISVLAGTTFPEKFGSIDFPLKEAWVGGANISGSN